MAFFLISAFFWGMAFASVDRQRWGGIFALIGILFSTLGYFF